MKIWYSVQGFLFISIGSISSRVELEQVSVLLMFTSLTATGAASQGRYTI